MKKMYELTAEFLHLSEVALDMQGKVGLLALFIPNNWLKMHGYPMHRRRPKRRR